LAGEFIDVHGLMRNTRETHPVLELLSRWERRAWDMLSALQRASLAAPLKPPMEIPEIGDPAVRAALG
jgi:hypothetical protein